MYVANGALKEVAILNKQVKCVWCTYAYLFVCLRMWSLLCVSHAHTYTHGFVFLFVRESEREREREESERERETD